jgi:hypothetical protein
MPDSTASLFQCPNPSFHHRNVLTGTRRVEKDPFSADKSTKSNKSTFSISINDSNNKVS